jgi:hypothetical protein
MFTATCWSEMFSDFFHDKENWARFFEIFEHCIDCVSEIFNSSNIFDSFKDDPYFILTDSALFQ